MTRITRRTSNVRTTTIYCAKVEPDTNIFHTTKPCLLTVADIAEGTQGVRRQRLEAGQDITVNTQLRAVKVYEEVNRVMAGRIDFNDLVDTVGRSFTQYDLDSAYLAWTSMFTKLDPVYTQSGSYNEDKLLDLIEHMRPWWNARTAPMATCFMLRPATPATPLSGPSLAKCRRWTTPSCL